MVKKTIAMILILGLVLNHTSYVYANNDSIVNVDVSEKVEEENEEIIGELIETFEQNMEIANDDTFLLDDEALMEELDEVDLTTLVEYSNNQGLEITEEELIELFINNIDNINKNIEDGELVRLEQGTLVDATDEGFYVQGGSTYDKNYWWGTRKYKSQAAAKTWAYQLTSSSTKIGVLTSALCVGFPLAGLATGYVSAQMAILSNKINYKNNSKGIVADVYVTLFSKVKSQ